MDITFNNAMVNIQNPNVSDLKIVSDNYDAAEIKDVGDMLLFIKDLSPRLTSLSVRYIIQRFMITYHGGAVMAIDYLPYMFYVVINTLLGGFLLSQTSLADIIKNNRQVRTFYPELVKIVQ